MRIWKPLRSLLKPEPVYAHCDIPCGIYDPHLAQVAAHTVVRMTTLAADLSKKGGLDDPAVKNTFVRYVQTKEEHAELAKRELRILWGDYFNADHLAKFPDLHEQVWGAVKAAGKARQSLATSDAEALLAAVNNVAETFWKTKGLETRRVKAPYPTEREMVVPVLA